MSVSKKTTLDDIISGTAPKKQAVSLWRDGQLTIQDKKIAALAHAAQEKKLLSSLGARSLEIINYNLNLRVLDDAFTNVSLKITNGYVIVRLYHLSDFHISETTKKPFYKGIPKVTTLNATRTHERQIENPFPYMLIGVVVNMDPRIGEAANFEVGDIVQIDSKYVNLEPRMGTSELYCPQEYHHPLEDIILSERTKGYVRVYPEAIMAVVKNFNIEKAMQLHKLVIDNTMEEEQEEYQEEYQDDNEKLES